MGVGEEVGEGDKRGGCGGRRARGEGTQDGDGDGVDVVEADSGENRDAGGVLGVTRMVGEGRVGRVGEESEGR